MNFSPIVQQKFRVNNQIRAAKLRVIDENGKQLGILSFSQALDAAQQKGLDLVEVQPNAQPPVAKIMEWAKFLYREKKIARKKHINRAGKVKGIRFMLSIFIHDLQIKAHRAQEFLEKGYKVRVDVRLRRFEQGLKDPVKNKIREFLGFIHLPIAFDQKPQKLPRGISFIIRKDIHAKNKQVDEKEVQAN